MRAGPLRRILLVGFMGSGKSSVGPLLARRLGWNFLDLDQEVEEVAGLSIPELFEREGEGGFRRLEAEVTASRLVRTETVFAMGGGWAAAPGRLDDLPPGSTAVWLRVRPETAVARVAREPGRRPLLDLAEPRRRAEELIREREVHYARAAVVVETDDLDPEAVAERIVDRLGLARGPATAGGPAGDAETGDRQESAEPNEIKHPKE